MSYDALFSPIKLRGLELKNRVVLPGMNTKMVKDKNDVGEDLPAYHAARAAGGCGLNIVELVSICPECHAYLYLGLYNEHHRDQLRKITDAIHAAGGKAGVQIWHGGFVPEEFFDKTNKLETPDTLTVERIHEIVKQFGYSAKLAVEAGFDALEFHGAHSYLPHEFMNPSLNKRTDEYGNQSLENRCRFNLEVIREMRKNMPEDMPLLMRLDAIDEMLPAVTTQDETVQFINWAAEAGVDAIDLSRGNARSLATVYEVPPYNLEPGFNMDNIAAIKARVNIPVIGVGRIVDPALADQLIREGKIDMVAVGRAQLADPEWCNKSKEGREAEIRRCIGCTEGCYDKVIDPKAKHITCTRNPGLCLEYKGLPKPEKAKNVMVIGAGIGGLMAAEYLKARGHNPTVYEATDAPGGHFVLAGKAPKKQAFTDAVMWDAEECKRMGIEIKTGVTVTPERQNTMCFTDSYANGVQVVIVKEGSDIKSIDDLEGKQIGTQRGTTGYSYCIDDYGEDSVVPFDDGATAVQNLLAGKVDCVVIDKAPAQEYVKANAGLTILDTEYANEDYAIGMAKDNTALQEALNKALAELKADGTIQSIIDKYISAK